jgi:leucyl/phenylalanyl-tRNA--protein transferase
MSTIEFPDPETHDFPDWLAFGDHYYRASDIIGFGGELSVENLISAYRKGIFPWPIDGIPLPWFCPQLRAVLEFSELHVPRSLAKERRKAELTFTIDRDLRGVIESCSKAARPGQPGTWIIPEFIDIYTELGRLGIVHSVEAWNAGGELVGGLYGVDAGGVFVGESMFYTQANASKLALLHLIDHLSSRGSTWLDNQVMTPHFEALGARDIPREQFLKKLKATQDLDLKIF